MLTPCALCGAAVIDGSRHLSWHLALGDLDSVNTLDPCPLDGMPVAVAGNSPDGSGRVEYCCGHRVSWPASA